MTDRSLKRGGDWSIKELAVLTLFKKTQVILKERFSTIKTKERKNLEPGFPVLWKAVLAIDRSSLGWLKWYFAIFTAV